MNKTTILAISAVFVASMIAITAYEVEAVKPQPQAQGVFVTGTGSIQSVTCPDNSNPTANWRSFGFQFVKGNDVLGQYRSIIGDTSIGNRLFFIWGNAEVNENDYTVKGYLESSGIALCSGITVPSAVSVSGNCGLSETITLATEQGMSVVMSGHVVCG